MTSEATIAKRIVRARRKIVDAGIPYRAPGPDELEERLREVLAVLYLMFNEGYLASAGDSSARRDLSDDAAWLTALLSKLLPGQPEVLGLLALMRMHLARGGARFDAAGALVLLRDQDRARWDHPRIQQAIALLEDASRLGRPGPYQLQAAIVACHADAPSWEATDWRQIVALYDELCRLAPNPVATLIARSRSHNWMAPPWPYRSSSSAVRSSAAITSITQPAPSFYRTSATSAPPMPRWSGPWS